MDRERFYGGGRREDGVAPDFTRLAHHDGGQGQQQQMECFSDEVSSRDGEEEKRDGSSSGAAVAAGSGSGGGGDGAAVETAKRRRGRPPGSKNKLKPLPVVTQNVEPAAAMRPHVLEIPDGGDVAVALAGFARRRGLGICVLAGTGVVADVPLRLPSPADGAAVVVLRGRYEILSISATFLLPSMSAAVPRAADRGVSVSLAGPQGQIIGGAVAGPLIAASNVFVLAAAFADLTFQRLPLEDEPSASVSGSGDADSKHRGHQQQPEPPQDASRVHVHPESMAPATTQPLPLYAHPQQHHPPDAWAPAASTQRPRPPYP
jgi:predicted DNA-binding protein with PD1-like motif